MLSCGYFDSDDSVYHVPAEDFAPAERNCDCVSCKGRIAVGDTSLEFKIYIPFDEQDYDGLSDEEFENIEQTDKYDHSAFMCENCAEIYLNLTDIGYCIYINDSMQQCLACYQRLTGFRGAYDE